MRRRVTDHHLLAMSYRLGGRGEDGTIDCHGVVLMKAQQDGLPLDDAWQQYEESWRRNEPVPHNGFGEGWRRVHNDTGLRDGDVLLYYDNHPWCAIVSRGYVWTASEEADGPFCFPASRWKRPPAEHWRHDPTARQARPAG